MMHGLLTESLAAVLGIIDAVVFSGEPNDVVDSNSVVAGFIPIVIFFDICHRKERIAADVGLLLSRNAQLLQ